MLTALSCIDPGRLVSRRVKHHSVATCLSSSASSCLVRKNWKKDRPLDFMPHPKSQQAFMTASQMEDVLSCSLEGPTTPSNSSGTSGQKYGCTEAELACLTLPALCCSWAGNTAFNFLLKGSRGNKSKYALFTQHDFTGYLALSALSCLWMKGNSAGNLSSNQSYRYQNHSGSKRTE